jgi:hypothetical protein
MNRLALLVIPLTFSVAFADVSIMENKKTVAVDCAKDKEVNLIGNHITVNLTGTCTKVTVTGNHGTVNGSATGVFVLGNQSTVNLDGVDTISIAGNQNTVSYKKPLAKKKTTVSNSGKDNKVTGG